MSFGGGPKCGKCGKSVYFNEKVDACGLAWHKSCFQCFDCNKSLDSGTVSERKDEGKTSIYCKGCYGKKFGPAGYGYGQGAGVMRTDFGGQRAAAPSGGGRGGGAATNFGGAEKCPRCGKSVYAAEKVIGAGSSWHKSCFCCKECNKKLDSTTLADKDGEIYCKDVYTMPFPKCSACYGKKFGPKGFGYGQGAGALVNTK